MKYRAFPLSYYAKKLIKVSYCVLIFICFSHTSSIFAAAEQQACASHSLYAIRCAVIIPTYNEEHRIEPMLIAYAEHFKNYNMQMIVVLNGITDNTRVVVEKQQEKHPHKIIIIESEKGKGNAIKTGFLYALNNPSYQFIGFVDADGSIAPNQYEKLLDTLVFESNIYDGIIASRYMKGSDIGTPRPLIKRYGSKLFYNRRIEKELGLKFKDYQCGAKLFKQKVVQTIAPLISETGWAIDLDLLYLSKEYGFKIKEIPIIWRDKEGSHLNILGSSSDLYNAIARIAKKKV